MARVSISIVAAVALLLAFTAPAGAVTPLLKQPKWVELSLQQREVLAPLAGEWDKLESYRRKKWLEIAQRYPSLSPDEQTRLQRRMQAWVKLTPEQRKQAREQYKTLQKVPPEQREAIKQKWQEYKELPPDEQERLKQRAKNKQPVATAPALAAKKPTLPLTPKLSSVQPAPAAPIAPAPTR